MTRSAPSLTVRPLLGLVALGVLPFYLAEILASARSKYWMGLSPGEWASSLGPAVLYWGFVALVAIAIDRGLSKLLPDSRFRLLTPFISSAAAITLLWMVIRHGLEPLLRSDLGYAFGVSLAIILLAELLRGIARLSIGPALIAGIGATAAAAFSLQVSAMTWATRVFGFDVAVSIALRHAAILGSLALLAGLIAARRPVLGWSAAIAVCLIGLGTPAVSKLRAEAAAEDRENVGPNIVLLTADSMRADFASVYGGATPTPSLEALARSGARFDQAISLAPWTVPSLAGLFSSKYPPSVSPGLDEAERGEQLSLYGQISSYWLGERGESLARRLGDRGYETGAFVANFAMLKQRWLLDDFDSHLVMPHSLETQRGPFSKSPFLSSTLRSLRPSLYELHSFDYTRAVTDLARQFIRYRKGQRFFLWAHYLDPHAPYDPPEAFRTTKGPFPFFPYEDRTHHENQKEYIQSLYSGEIRYVDASIGRILETLHELGLADRTYVVFASDHGEELWDHEGFGHGHSVFDELLRVPLLIAGPGIAPQTVDQPVSTIDLLPTLTDWTGLAADPQWRGSSWADALQRGKFEGAGAPVFSQATGVLPAPPEPLQSVVLGDYKLIRGMESGQVRLYDRAKDPGEHRDLARAHPQLVRRMRDALDRWARSFPVTFDTFGAEGQMPEPDPETIENLKALGYLPDDSP